MIDDDIFMTVAAKGIVMSAAIHHAFVLITVTQPEPAGSSSGGSALVPLLVLGGLAAGAGGLVFMGSRRKKRAEAAALVENSDIDGLAWADADEATAAVRADALQAVAVDTGSVEAHDLALLWRVRAGHHRAGERLHTEG